MQFILQCYGCSAFVRSVVVQKKCCCDKTQHIDHNRPITLLHRHNPFSGGERNKLLPPFSRNNVLQVSPNVSTLQETSNNSSYRSTDFLLWHLPTVILLQILLAHKHGIQDGDGGRKSGETHLIQLYLQPTNFGGQRRGEKCPGTGTGRVITEANTTLMQQRIWGWCHYIALHCKPIVVSRIESPSV